MTWEERWHPLREEWVVLAAHRGSRPWSGEMKEAGGHVAPDYVPGCYLCPRNARAGGAAVNPDYEGIYGFDNDFPCVGPNAPTEIAPTADPNVFQTRPASGIARVVCYSPRHNLTLAQLDTPQIASLLTTWQEQYVELGARPEVAHVLIFENKGEQVGVSNPHPHCQIYATNFVFKTIATEVSATDRYLSEKGRVLFADLIAAEKVDGRRILFENDYAIAFLPYFARYSYEVYVAPKATPRPHIAALSATEIDGLADVLRSVVIAYDNLWRMPFPYVMALHNAPTDNRDGGYPGFHFHIELHPPLRAPNLLKYLAGPEIGGGSFISDSAPEDKAKELQGLPREHYTAT
jgi:UDPglucose--hexose-1-phosphate uridylyltransferase